MSAPRSAAVPIIRFDNVTKTYGTGAGTVNALQNVHLDIREGEFIAIMGPSGSGKSTALNILGCLDVPSSGRYLFDDVIVNDLDRDARAILRRYCLGFVFQGFNLLARTSALENVEMPLIYRGMGLSERRRLAERALAIVGLDGRAHHMPNELSGGQQQRVAIARAIVTNPRILLADEPTGNLDTKTSRDIMALLTVLNREQGITIVMVTHEVEMAAYARRTIGFRDGRIETDALHEAA